METVQKRSKQTRGAHGFESLPSNYRCSSKAQTGKPRKPREQPQTQWDKAHMCRHNNKEKDKHPRQPWDDDIPPDVAGHYPGRRHQTRQGIRLKSLERRHRPAVESKTVGTLVNVGTDRPESTDSRSCNSVDNSARPCNSAGVACNSISAWGR